MPATIGVIDIEHGAESALIVQPSDPVTILNLLESGHRPPLLLEGMINESECFPDRFAPNFSFCRRAIIHPEADASTNLRRPLGANVKLSGPQIGRVQGTFGWQPKRWVAVVWIEATNPSSCSWLYRECDRPRMTPKNAGTMPS